jgi:tRNA A-37 threonylcarbamoyl transferase component Bud32
MTDDFAYDLFAEWEERQALGRPVPFEDICADRPDLLDKVRTIAARLAGFPALGQFAPPAGADGRPDWVEIGCGASSVVYRGYNRDLGTEVAYKVLRPRDEALSAADTLRLMRRFELEARILARLKHQAIVRIYKTFFHGGRPALEMEYLPGGTLTKNQRAVRAGGPVAVARFMERVAGAVGFAHAHGIVHRDLKPSNILLDADGRPCVSDFGVAKLLRRDEDDPPPLADAPAAEPELATRTGRQPGTWAYMAPEQFDSRYGAVSPATDVWALGVVFYELLSGRHPFASDTRERLRERVCHGPVPPIPRGRLNGVERRLWWIVRRCLEKWPARRYTAAELVADALRDATAPRRVWLLAGTALVAGVALAGAHYTVAPDPQKDSGPQAVMAGAAPEKPQQKPEWWDHPTVRDATAKLTRGEPAVLIDRGRPRAAHWVTGPASGKFLQSENGRCVLSSTYAGGAMLELLPSLPPGQFLVEAELEHLTANGMSWVGTYAWASHGEIARGRQHFFVLTRYADWGVFGQDDPAAGGVAENRRTHLLALYLGDSDRHPVASRQEFGLPPGGALIPPPARGPRTIGLVIDSTGATAEQGRGVMTGVMTAASVRRVFDRARGGHPDLEGALEPRPDGGVGLYVYNGTLAVDRLTITPLTPSD